MLDWTGERFLPWIKQSTIAYEHLHRYAYAAALVRGKRVLDLASGEGYGSKLLAASASSVVGIDIDAGVIQHAVGRYPSSNLHFLCGSITAVPLPDDHSFDVIVCFEAIEHIDDQEKLLAEVKRLLKPQGLFVVSTPNKAVYHDHSKEENPFHVKELYFEEFDQLLRRYFQNVQFLGQRIHPGSSIWPIDGRESGFSEFVIDRCNADFEFVDAARRVPLYFIGIASNAADVLHAPGSVLLDQSDGLIEEKNQEIRWREQQIAERDQTIASLEDAMKWREGQIHEQEAQIQQLTEGLAWTRNCVGDQAITIAEQTRTIASHDEALAWRAQQVSELEAARTYLERENASIRENLQNTQRQLSVTTATLAGIYASRGWKCIMRLRLIRDRLKGLVKFRA